MEEMQKVPALILKMQALRDSLSNAEANVIDYIIEHPDQVIRLSVAGLAAKCGSSEATVVRACRRIGLNGYQDLKVTLAQHIVTPLQSIHEEVNESDTVESILSKVFQSTIHTITLTHDLLKPETVEKAIDVLMHARRVLIIGLGNSHAVAQDLQHKLLRLGIDARAICDTHMQMIAAISLTERDCLFAISQSGSSRDIVECAQLVKEKNVPIISMTDIEPSPLSKISDVALHTASNETSFRITAQRSRIAQMILIDTIYTIIAMRVPELSEKFRQIERAMIQKKL